MSDHSPPQAAASLARPDGATIAYCRIEGSAPGVIFLGGFSSDMTGTKATALEAWCRDAGSAFLRFDYFGHGASSGSFVEGTIGRWKEDALAVLDRLSEGPQVLVGSSMGAWIMLLVALARPERVRGLVGIAGAPDFTEDLIWARLGARERDRLMHEGVLTQTSRYGPTPYPIAWRLVREGRDHRLLGGAVPLTCPVRLLHGMADPDVPWQTSVRTAERLASADVTLTLIKDGDHRLSRPDDLARIFLAVAELRGDTR